MGDSRSSAYPKEDLFTHDPEKAKATLERAKVANANKIYPVRIDRNTVVFMTEKKAKDKKFVQELRKQLTY